MFIKNLQFKREAYWFYFLLSRVYDNYVNPLFWNEKMRDKSLELADFSSSNLLTIDVGSGTGFTTQGIVQYINPKNIVCLDQSPHQMVYARKKKSIKDCSFKLGDAENLPFPTDYFDRYVSAGSIEYWPNPAKGIAEAYRVIKPLQKALIIGPLYPENKVIRFLASIFMLFPKEKEYKQWFQKVGFTDVHSIYIKPYWVKKEKYSIAIVGTKPISASSPQVTYAEEKEEKKKSMYFLNTIYLFCRLFLGSFVTFLSIPIALSAHFSLYIKNIFLPSSKKLDLEPLTIHQKIMISLFFIILILSLVITI